MLEVLEQASAQVDPRLLPTLEGDPSRIRQVERVRFINPQFDVETTFTREDFTNIFVEKFGVPREQVIAFYDHLAQMNYYDNDRRTTKEMFEEFFPGRNDVHRLLMAPITYANWEEIRILNAPATPTPRAAAAASSGPAGRCFRWHASWRRSWLRADRPTADGTPQQRVPSLCVKRQPEAVRSARRSSAG